MSTGESNRLGLLPAVARAAIQARLHGEPMPPGPAPEGQLARRAPVFVTLRRDGELRGCIGSLVPLEPNLVRETQNRAVAAAFDDPRFPPLSTDELRRCSIEVSVLGPLQPVQSAQELDPSRYGVEVSDDLGRRGVLLPGIEGIDTVAEQLRLVRLKAGIAPDVPVRLRRFEVVALEENAPEQPSAPKP